jgi:hypothetical protein
MHFLVAAVLAGAMFLLIVFVFVPLGQTVSQQMNVAPKPPARLFLESAGKFLAGVLFVLPGEPPRAAACPVDGHRASRLRPARDHATRPASVASLVVPLVLLLHAGAGPGTQILWTPYQQVQYTREQMPNGEVWGGSMQVNHTF